VNVYPNGERDLMTTKGRGLFAFVGKKNAVCREIFWRPQQKKTPVGTGKNGLFAYTGQRNAVFTGKNGPVPSTDFSLPEARKKAGRL